MVIVFQIPNNVAHQPPPLPSEIRARLNPRGPFRETELLDAREWAGAGGVVGIVLTGVSLRLLFSDPRRRAVWDRLAATAVVDSRHFRIARPAVG
jgi:hypothetical protein